MLTSTRALSPALPLQAELNSNLHEQVVLLREQKELSEARAEKSAAEVKKLFAKVRGVLEWAGRLQLGRLPLPARWVQL